MKMGTTHTNFCTADAVAATYAHSMGLSCMLGCLDSLCLDQLTQEPPIGLELASRWHGTPSSSSLTTPALPHRPRRRYGTHWIGVRRPACGCPRHGWTNPRLSYGHGRVMNNVTPAPPSRVQRHREQVIQATRHFLEVGGTLEAALDLVVEGARREFGGLRIFVHRPAELRIDGVMSRWPHA